MSNEDELNEDEVCEFCGFNEVQLGRTVCSSPPIDYCEAAIDASTNLPK